MRRISTEPCGGWWSAGSRRVNVRLFNMWIEPGPPIKEHVTSIGKVFGINRSYLTVRYRLLLVAAQVIDAFARPLGIKHPFSPVRIKQLHRSNNILPAYLVKSGHTFSYDF